MNARRPEHAGVAATVYGAAPARTYARSSRLSHVQTQLAERCIELLALPEGNQSLVLDIGAGTGFSTRAIEAAGHFPIATDLSRPMLMEARKAYAKSSSSDSEDEEGEDDEDEQDEEEDNDTEMKAETELPGAPAEMLESDMGEGMPFRPGSVDGAISVSAIQWLCSASTSLQSPHKRLRIFFSTLYAALRKSARAALQFYPESPAQTALITSAAMRAGFSGGLLVDYPNSSKAKKTYLVLTAGPPAPSSRAPTPLGVETESTVKVGRRRTNKKKEERVARKDWIIQKKERRRRQGHETRPDSKYTGRKRRTKF